MAKIRRKKDKRQAGILMPLASLPSNEGVGGMGAEAYKFVDLAVEMGFSIWQLLPLNPLGYGNSPYQPYSSFAGDEIYISLAALEKAGYLPEGFEPFAVTGDADRIDYVAVREYKEKYLRIASRNFYAKDAGSEDFKAFVSQPWVRQYGAFLALKRQNGMRTWNEWPKAQRDWVLDGKYDISHLEEEIDYRVFAQYMFIKQWMKLKKYANSKKLKLMGDIPFYVGLDSQDVWASRENFLLNKDGHPDFIAGVPPDCFNSDGQRWGNPIYDWEYMEKDGFSFWLDRIGYTADLYDIIRIDHFRAFDTYWKVPSTCPTAKEGDWIEAPGSEFFNLLFEKRPKIEIVAEDLGGDFVPGVIALRKEFNLMGMNVADFTLLSPQQPIKHQVIYTGTHDNQTVIGWYRSMKRSEQKKFRNALADYGTPRESVAKKMLRYVFGSVSAMAIVPVGDILGLDDRGRINSPGTVGSPNWEWRMESYEPLEKKVGFIKDLLIETQRAK